MYLNKVLLGSYEERMDKRKGKYKPKLVMCFPKADFLYNVEAKASVRCCSASEDSNCLFDPLSKGHGYINLKTKVPIVSRDQVPGCLLHLTMGLNTMAL